MDTHPMWLLILMFLLPIFICLMITNIAYVSLGFPRGSLDIMTMDFGKSTLEVVSMYLTTPLIFVSVYLLVLYRRHIKSTQVFRDSLHETVEVLNIDSGIYSRKARSSLE